MKEDKITSGETIDKKQVLDRDQQHVGLAKGRVASKRKKNVLRVC